MAPTPLGLSTAETVVKLSAGLLNIGWRTICQHAKHQILTISNAAREPLTNTEYDGYNFYQTTIMASTVSRWICTGITESEPGLLENWSFLQNF